MISLNVKNYLDSQMVKNNKFLVGNQQPSSFRNGGEGSETIESNLSNNKFYG